MIPEIDSSSDQESVDDVWSINDEQREYYIRQFQNIEPDVNGQITGNLLLQHFCFKLTFLKLDTVDSEIFAWSLFRNLFISELFASS